MSSSAEIIMALLQPVEYYSFKKFGILADGRVCDGITFSDKI